MKNLYMTQSTYRILQITDIHLMKCPSDDQTYDLMKKAIIDTKPDFIIITGDITMTHDNIELLNNLRIFLDSFSIYWSFVFGNHDHESLLSLDEQANILMNSQYCCFEKGNPLIKGCGNHYLKVVKDDQLIALLGMLDTHNTRIDVIDGKEIWSYDYLDQGQIDDTIQTIESLKEEYNTFSSLFFFHIPLTEYKKAIEQNDVSIKGSCFEEISCSKYDSFFFPQVLKTNTLKGVFVGHDHVCDFSFMNEGCLLAFGRCTGHYNYTMPSFQKGARVIDIDKLGSISSWVYLE
jgi:predicted phosphodiesterase